MGCRQLAAVLACGFFAVSCSSTTPSHLSVNPNTQSVPAAGQNGLTTTVDSNVSWTAASDASFVTITAGSSGTNSGTITYNVAANGGTSQQTAHITVSGGGLTVQLTVTEASQSTTAPSLSLNPSAQSVVASGQIGLMVMVTAVPSTLSWTATSSDTSQLTITSGASGTGSGTITYNVAANAGTSTLMPTITVSGGGQTAQLTVTEAGGSGPSVSLSQSTLNVNANALTGQTVGVTSTISWTATSDQSFVTITDGASGSGNGTVKYSIAANGTVPTLTAHIKVAGSGGSPSATLTITQTGLTASFGTTPTVPPLPGAMCNVEPVSGTPTMKCTFDASSSVPQALIKSFQFTVPGFNSSEVLGSTKIVTDPSTGCGFATGLTPLTIQLTITTAQGTATKTMTVVFQKNGIC